MVKNKEKDQIVIEFLQFLASTGISKNTIRFYKSDLTHFKGWLILKLRNNGILIDEFKQALPFIKNSFANEYRQYLVENKLALKTVNRRLSTLRSLAQFFLTSQILDFNFTDGLNNLANIHNKQIQTSPLIEGFQKYLEAEKVSKNTVKNYLADVRHFLLWLEKQTYVT